LKKLPGDQRKSVAVIGYEHVPPKINLAPLVEFFEVICENVIGIRLSKKVENYRSGLAHPVHQTIRVFAWEVLQIA
jgi:hypothetical protein